MNAQQVAERRELYARIDAAQDNHLAPRVAIDPPVFYGRTQEWFGTREAICSRPPCRRWWAVAPLEQPPQAWRFQPSVVDDFGNLVAVGALR